MSKPTLNQKAMEVLEGLQDLLEASGEANLSNPKRKRLTERIEAMRDRLELLTRRIDQTQMPEAFFDPAEPTLIGNFVALALVAQDRKPLAGITKFYGSGVYAIYYSGPASLYAPISGSETPIYVGKADPKGSNPKTPVEQGTKLSDRLREHMRNIGKVSGVEIEDFTYRALAVQTGYQAAAESHLIKMFKPIWNNETRILFGIGKHGDKSTTRQNNKSPFDTVHPGRKWAAGNPEAKTVEDITADAAAHFRSATIFMEKEDVFSAFIETMKREEQLDPATRLEDLR